MSVEWAPYKFSRMLREHVDYLCSHAYLVVSSSSIREFVGIPVIQAFILDMDVGHPGVCWTCMHSFRDFICIMDTYRRI
jgi:hypothetical protein